MMIGDDGGWRMAAYIGHRQSERSIVQYHHLTTCQINVTNLLPTDSRLQETKQVSKQPQKTKMTQAGFEPAPMKTGA